MESDDDFELFSSPKEEASFPVYERKLKRLKKAVRVSQDSHLDQSDGDPFMPEAISPKYGSQDVQESNELLQSRSGSEDFSDENAMGSGFTGLGGDGDGSGARRALDFEVSGDELDENGEDREKEIQEESGDVSMEEEKGEDRKKGIQEESGDGSMEDEKGEDRKKEIHEESGDASMEELEKKRRSPDDLEEKKNKKKRTEDKESAAIKRRMEKERRENMKQQRRMEKERRENMKQLRVESQRLLRESSVAAFKPTPLVQKPISSVLEKIRRRKLEISKKSITVSSTTFIENIDDSTREILEDHNIGVHADERGDGKVSKATIEEAIQCPTEAENNVDGLCIDGSNDIITNSSFGGVPYEMAVDEESKQEFRAPIDDTQDLFSDSQTSEMKDDLMNDTPSSPLEEVFAPSILAMNLKLDSAPPDDNSSDDEDNDKENLDPHPHGMADLSLSPNDDPVKAFVDDEAEEEDDSDNDLLRFQDNDEDEDDGDAEELNDMIATGYEEQPMDNEKRNELHQKWLEQQDAAGTENLMQKLKCGSMLRETTLLEEELAEGEEDEEFSYGAAEDLVPANVVRMNLRKVKQMIPQMFTDNDNTYLSDDEETEKRLTKQCLLGKAEERATFLSPAEDESSREIFGLIKKLNIVPNTTKKAKTPSCFEMPLTGGNRNISSKSSFLWRGSNHCLPSSKKRGLGTARSFIFNEMIATAEAQYQSQPEDSSETIENLNRPRTASVKFSSSQIRTSSQKLTTAAVKPTTSLLDILRKTSLKSKQCTQDNTVSQTESVLASFKLVKKPMKPNEDSTVYIKS